MFGSTSFRIAALLFIVLLLHPLNASSQSAQVPSNRSNKSSGQPQKKDPSQTAGTDADAIDAQRRAFAVALIRGLAEEARSYNDVSLRARILARAADALWEFDKEAARAIFRRAWEMAEVADKEEDTSPANAQVAAVLIIAINKGSGGDMRSQVLSLVARHDRGLAEEFLAKLKAASDEGNTRDNKTGESSSTEDAARRLRIATQLLEDGQIDASIVLATPTLTQVNERTIGYLTSLRQKRPALADEKFLLLVERAELDPTADANTVSGLSSYAFTPGVYISFSNGGSEFWNMTEPLAAPDLPEVIRKRFFEVSGNILLRPSPPSAQDVSSAGRVGRIMIIRRLLPLFDQYAPGTAAALRSQLMSLAEQNDNSDNDPLLNAGLEPGVNANESLDKLQDRIDRAKTSRERDTIYADTARALAISGDPAAQEIADKIDNDQRRSSVREFVDLALAKHALRKKDTSTTLRLAHSDYLTSFERVWVYAKLVEILNTTQRSRALSLLEEALAESRRIDSDDPNRVMALFAVASHFLPDETRPWEIMSEAVKAANAMEHFTGEDGGISRALATENGIKFIQLEGTEFNLSSIFRTLTKVDLTRATELAKGFKSDEPRALAILAVTSAALERQRSQSSH